MLESAALRMITSSGTLHGDSRNPDLSRCQLLGAGALNSICAGDRGLQGTAYQHDPRPLREPLHYAADVVWTWLRNRGAGRILPAGTGGHDFTSCRRAPGPRAPDSGWANGELWQSPRG